MAQPFRSHIIRKNAKKNAPFFPSLLSLIRDLLCIHSSCSSHSRDALFCSKITVSGKKSENVSKVGTKALASLFKPWFRSDFRPLFPPFGNCFFDPFDLFSLPVLLLHRRTLQSYKPCKRAERTSDFCSHIHTHFLSASFILFSLLFSSFSYASRSFRVCRSIFPLLFFSLPFLLTIPNRSLYQVISSLDSWLVC